MVNIKTDSRKVNNNDIFVALKGFNSSGEDYIEGAINNGASKVIVESDNIYNIETIKVEDTRKYLLEYLKNNYGNILNEMTLIGITGTNGKTTTAYLIYQMLNKLNIKCGYIGTIGYYLDKKVCNLPNTSPDICDMYDMIVNAYELGYKTIVMEVSSQGIDMGRLDTIKFDYGIFTNLTQDHLDYHKTMENYAKAKQKLFYNLKENGISIINSDDKYNSYFKIGKYVEYGINNNDYKIEEYNLDYKINFVLNIKGNKYNIKSNLIGKYNMYNLVSSITVLNEMNISINDILNVVEDVSCPPGRTDIINYKNNLIIVDYAHTPDAMENIYNLVKEINKGNVYTVFGCTGDRDRLKRPIMMDLATSNSNYVIFTSDDLHDEDFNNIVSDATKDINKTNFEVIMDRGKAIEKGINLLKDKDILLILGKGHEEFIIVKDNKIPFNDKKYVESLLKQYINT